jgi:hypothetical protein
VARKVFLIRDKKVFSYSWILKKELFLTSSKFRLRVSWKRSLVLSMKDQNRPDLETGKSKENVMIFKLKLILFIMTLIQRESY